MFVVWLSYFALSFLVWRWFHCRLLYLHDFFYAFSCFVIQFRSQFLLLHPIDIYMFCVEKCKEKKNQKINKITTRCPKKKIWSICSVIPTIEAKVPLFVFCSLDSQTVRYNGFAERTEFAISKTFIESNRSCSESDREQDHRDDLIFYVSRLATQPLCQCNSL